MEDLIGKTYLLGEHRLDRETRTLWRNGERVHLTRRPFDVLLYLIENRKRLVSRAELLDRFWDGKDVYEDALSKAVGAIRKALHDTLDDPRFIETRWAGGYRYIGPLSEAPSTLREFERVREVRIAIDEEEIPGNAPANVIVSASAASASTTATKSAYLWTAACLLVGVLIVLGET